MQIRLWELPWSGRFLPPPSRGWGRECTATICPTICGFRARPATPGPAASSSIALTPAEMDRRAAPHLPTSIQCYLLGSRGERFPFLNPRAATFFDGRPASRKRVTLRNCNRLACVERWGYERLEACGVVVGSEGILCRKRCLESGAVAASRQLASPHRGAICPPHGVVRGSHPGGGDSSLWGGFDRGNPWNDAHLGGLHAGVGSGQSSRTLTNFSAPPAPATGSNNPHKWHAELWTAAACCRFFTTQLAGWGIPPRP